MDSIPISRMTIEDIALRARYRIEDELELYHVWRGNSRLEAIGTYNYEIDLPFEASDVEREHRTRLYIAAAREASEMAVELLASGIDNKGFFNWGAQRYIKLLTALGERIRVPPKALINLTAHSIFAPNFEGEDAFIRFLKVSPITLRQRVQAEITALAPSINLSDEIGISQMVALYVSLTSEIDSANPQLYIENPYTDLNKNPKLEPPFSGGIMNTATGEFAISRPDYITKATSTLAVLMATAFSPSVSYSPNIVNLFLYSVVIALAAYGIRISIDKTNKATHSKWHEIIHFYELHFSGDEFKYGLLEAERFPEEA